MKILISPAKSIDTNSSIQTPFSSEAAFLKEADILMKKLAKLSKKKLIDLMHVSPQIAELNKERNNNWQIPTKQTSEIKPTITMFTGEVYRGLDVGSFNNAHFEFAQENLRILSGLYGILKPLDLMYPYRLEMGTKWQISAKQKNLYAFWGNKINNYLSKELTANETIVNLASSEYFKVVQTQSIKHRVITPIFKDFKNGKLKVIMMYAKNARGAMAKYIIQNKLDSPEQIKEFAVGNYRFDETESSENEWIFTR